MHLVEVLPLNVVQDEKFNVFGTCSLIIPTLEDSQILLRAYMYGRKEVLYNTNACFIIE